MKPLFTFTLAVKDENTPLVHLLNRVADSVQPATAHVIGATSGTTGILLWAEYAKHLTAFVGLAVACMALCGGTFYALYWAAKMFREWRDVLRESKQVEKEKD